MGCPLEIGRFDASVFSLFGPVGMLMLKCGSKSMARHSTVQCNLAEVCHEDVEIDFFDDVQTLFGTPFPQRSSLISSHLQGAEMVVSIFELSLNHAAAELHSASLPLCVI